MMIHRTSKKKTKKSSCFPSRKPLVPSSFFCNAPVLSGLQEFFLQMLFMSLRASAFRFQTVIVFLSLEGFSPARSGTCSDAFILAHSIAHVSYSFDY